jgi:hypothetical protein
MLVGSSFVAGFLECFNTSLHQAIWKLKETGGIRRLRHGGKAAPERQEDQGSRVIFRVRVPSGVCSR